MDVKKSKGNSIKQHKNTSAEKTATISYYFWREWKVLLIVTISGLIYNTGLVAVPWFEGRSPDVLWIF